ncbi:hypothetical protein QCA50_007678 [Cerrena zonata]|uniref:L-dopachrome isomerase n=1 Tax=Cerrena zonata TaxID=2478898 RepID=A0AAW0G982_9APHY
MPALELKTNVKLEDAKPFIQEFSKFSAELLGKPLAYIATSYTYNEHLAWEGTFEPAFLLSVASLDNITPETTEVYSKKLFEFLKEKLALPGNRGYIVFTDPGRSNIGYQSTTFESIFGKK